MLFRSDLLPWRRRLERVHLAGEGEVRGLGQVALGEPVVDLLDVQAVDGVADALGLRREGIDEPVDRQQPGVGAPDEVVDEGEAQARVLRAQGEAEAIQKVFDAIHAGDADEKVLAYQYLQALPSIANGTANKVWVVPAELTTAMQNLSGAFRASPAGAPVEPTGGHSAEPA